MPIELQAITIVAAGLFLAGVIKGATGLGYASCALPFLVYAIGLKPAIGLVLAPAMATNVVLAFANGHLRETCLGFAPLYAAMLPGIAAGMSLLLLVDTRIAVAALGVTIIAYALFALATPGWRLSMRSVRALQMPVGAINGLVTGLTGSQVMPLVPYFMATGLDAPRTVQAINLGVTLASSAMLAGLIYSEAVAQPILAISIAAIVPALAGVEVGQRLRGRLPEERIRTAILVVLLLSGLGLLLR